MSKSPNAISLEPTVYERTSGYYNDDSVKFISIKDIRKDEKFAIKVSAISSYRDNKWVFQKEFPYLNRHENTLNFDIRLDDETCLTDQENYVYLEIAKDMLYTMLTDPVSSRPKFTSYKRILWKGLKHLFSFMKMSAITKLSDIDETDAEEFLEYVAGIRVYRNEDKPITNRTLASRVQGVDYLFEQAPKMKDGLLVNFFEEYGSRTSWSRVVAEKVIGRKESRTLEMPDEIAKKLIKCAISELAISDCLARIYEVDKKYNNKEIPSKKWAKLREEIYRQHGYWDGHMDAHKRGTLESRLRAACYTIIALLTGMRLHEVLNIQYATEQHWSTETIDIDGQFLTLCFVKSKTTKLEAKPTAYKWQTVPIVKFALEALQKAHERYFDRGNIWLFPGRTSNAQMGKGSMGHNLKTFMVTHDIRFNGRVWNLSSHQFRKKFARIMVRQGLGLRELQDQLKHYDIEMTKVYGDPNLYAELQAEKFALSEELMEEFIGSQVPIIGGGAEEIEKIRKEYRGMAKNDRIKFLKSIPSRGLVEQTDDGLCFYRASKALCGGDKANCRPADCNNSFMPAAGKKKTFLYRKEENNRLIDFFKDQPFKVSHLKARNQEIDKLLGQLIPLENLP